MGAWFFPLDSYLLREGSQELEYLSENNSQPYMGKKIVIKPPYKYTTYN